MPKAIPVPHKQQADIDVLHAIVAILSMMVLAAFLAASFPAGPDDSDAPTDVRQLWAP